jgi:hypothetical protein
MRRYNVNIIFLSRVLSCLVFLYSAAGARLPGELPGEEITEEQYLEYKIPGDSIALKVPEKSPLSPTWLDLVSATWDAPSLAGQMAQDDQQPQLGMGAVFVPRMARAESEPDVEILDGSGEGVARGKPGRKLNLVAGSYYVLLGSGTHKQRIVRKFESEDGKTRTLFPDWSTLTVNVVNEDNFPFRGEYELARIDGFEAYGRAYGADPDLGEEVKTWVLRPGLYKIFGVGQSYNTMNNFITVKLLPGEYTRIILVQNEDDMTISGGGASADRLEHGADKWWKFGLNIGGTMDFSALRERKGEDTTTMKVSLELLSNIWMNYTRERIEWNTRLYIDEGVIFNREESRLTSQPDEGMRLMSLFTWRFLKRFGPYGRLEGMTGLVPQYARAVNANGEYYFVFLNHDSSVSRIDSLSDSWLTEPAFSPLLFEAGAGANTSLLNTGHFEARLLIGIGFTQESRFRETETNIPDSAVGINGGTADTSVFRRIDALDLPHVNLRPIGTTTTRPEYGPEISLYTTVRFGRLGTDNSELKIKAPVVRMGEPGFRPDIVWRNTLSWNLIKNMTLDYQVLYTLRWPHEENLRTDNWLHRIILRFSFSSR